MKNADQTRLNILVFSLFSLNLVYSQIIKHINYSYKIADLPIRPILVNINKQTKTIKSQQKYSSTSKIDSDGTRDPIWMISSTV